MDSKNANHGVIGDSSSKKNEPLWLKEHRSKAFRLYKELGYPALRYGLHVTSNTHNINLDELDIDIEPSFTIKYSEGILVEDLDKAVSENKYLENYFMSLVRYDENKFTAFHAAAWSKGIFIKVPKGIKIKKPVEIDLNLNSKASIYNILVLAEPSSSATIILRASSERKDIGGFRSEVLEVFAKECSSIKFVSAQDFGDKVDNFSIKRASIEKDAMLEWVDFNIGSNSSRIEASSFLTGEGAQTRSCSLFLGNKNQNFDLLTTAIHQSSHTKSEIVVKGSLNDKARAIMRGLIHIQNNAPKSEAHQKIDALLLGDGAGADPIPKLEIDNNDVKCGHGASVGRIDENKLFYLMSRGLTEEQAKLKMLEGFFDSVLQKVKLEDIRGEINKAIVERYGNRN